MRCRDGRVRVRPLAMRRRGLYTLAVVARPRGGPPNAENDSRDEEGVAVNVLETIPIEAWSGPFGREVEARALAALERGQILFFPRLGFAIEAAERQIVSADSADGRAKNISFDPATAACQGTSLKGVELERLRAMMERFAIGATQLISDLLPRYAASLERARTSFRPVEVAGRTYSPLKDDRRLHVDAFPSRPTRGRRILRFFSNVAADDAPRVWRVGEPFEDFARRFLPRVGEPTAGSAWLLEGLGITKGRRTPYDQLMLRLHDRAKRDDVYQDQAPRVEIAFPPGASWLVFTDQVLHAALGGRGALEQTFHLDVAAMAEPARAPLRVLERLAGRTLA